MNTIMQMTFLGIIAGMVACFWTRIIQCDMIFRKFGRWLEVKNNRHLIDHTTDSLLIKFVRCSFCISVWLVFLLELFYIIIYTPWWLNCVIGILGGLGAGNLVCELIYALRNESL
jgi:hypothetical protein